MSRWPKWQHAASALGGAVVAVALNDLSALSHHTQVEVFGAAATILVAWGVGKLPPQSRLSRYARWFFLVSAATAAVVAALSPARNVLIPIAAAAVLTAGAAVLVTCQGADLDTGLKAAMELVTRVAFMAGGVAFLRTGTALLTHRQVLIGLAFAELGLAFLGTGIALLTGRWAFIAATTVGGPGLTFVVLGAVMLADRHAPSYIALIGVGLAFIMDGMALAADRRLPGYAAVIASGVAIIGTGVALLSGRQLLVGGAVIWLGTAIIGIAVAALTGRHILGYGAATTSGLAVIASGIAWHADQQALIVAMVIASGVAITGFETAEIGTSTAASGLRLISDFLIKPPPG